MRRSKARLFLNRCHGAFVLFVLTAAGAAALLFTGNTSAQSAYPNQPLRLVVPFAAGGGNDIMGRLIGSHMAKVLGQSVVVENRVGAGGRIGVAAVVQAKPDGYTLLVTGMSSHIFLKAMPPDLPFDPATALVPVGIFARVPMVIVAAPPLGIKDLRSAVALFKGSPGKYAYGSGGIGALNHVGMALTMKLLGVDLLHVPYKGSSPSLVDLAAGRIALVLDGVGAISPLVNGGQLQALAILDTQRSKQLPDVPTATEAGFPELLKYDLSPWNAIAVPAGTPASIIESLNKALEKAVQNPEAAQRFEELGYVSMVTSVKEARDYVDRQFATWIPVVKAMNFKE